MNNRKKKPVSFKKVLLIAVCAVLALVLCVMLGATVYVESLMGKLNRTDDTLQETLSQDEIDKILNEPEGTVDPSFTGPVLDPEDVDWGTTPVQTITGENIINILLIGQDRREGQGRQRSDSMILVTVNKSAKTLTMTSFMRDMYVQIPGYRDSKINACYQIGGMDLLDACLEKNFGVVVDGNIEVDFDGFMEIIDLIGGIPMELTKSEASYLNANGNWGVTDDRDWTLKEGMNQLTGEQALAYSRIRYITSDDTESRADSDYGRTYRQRKVLTAIMEKAKTLSVLELNTLAQTAVGLVTTDMSNSEIFKYVGEMLPLLSELEIVTQRIPADGAYREATLSNGDSVIIPNLEKNQQLLIDTLTK